MLTLFNVLEGALNELESVEGVQPDEVNEVEVELFNLGTQGAKVEFSEWNYTCFTYENWLPGDFIGFRTDECYHCGKKGCTCYADGFGENAS